MSLVKEEQISVQFTSHFDILSDWFISAFKVNCHSLCVCLVPPKPEDSVMKISSCDIHKLERDE